jgi:thymidylate synthase (FAD)
MQIVQPGFSVFKHPESNDRESILKQIERIGRVCYRSEGLITDTSYLDFVQKIRNRGHWAMLEHYQFVFEIPKKMYEEIMNHYPNHLEYNYNKAMKYVTLSFCGDGPNRVYLISGSATALNNIYLASAADPSIRRFKSVLKVYKALVELVPEIMFVDDYTDSISSDGIRLLSREEIEYLPVEARILHDSLTVMFTVNRGITHELVRHRPAAWAQESTRYCNYQLDKFNNEISVIDPIYYKDRPNEYEIWRDACEYAEKAYFDLKNNGSKPEEARDILPHATKVDIAMTAPLHEYIHFFRMRVPNSAHPQMREVTIPFYEQCLEQIPSVFTRVFEKKS